MPRASRRWARSPGRATRPSTTAAGTRPRCAAASAPRWRPRSCWALRATGLRAAFGTDGKSLQVGLAASSGVQAARLALHGARAPLHEAARGWEEATGGTFAQAEPERRAIDENWIKAWPCCLQTHGAIEAAERLRGGETGALGVTVHPVSLQAAAVGPEPADGLQAKFSIPYLTAYTLLHGPPGVDSFASVDAAAVERARDIAVRTDSGLLESEFVLTGRDGEIARVKAALGSPARPMDEDALRAKVESLAGADAAGALDELGRPAAELLALAGIGGG